ncbi:hypothetical protein GGQ87_002881 [Brevundimonas alba]|uniref:Uncharacterized protein n=1 Tax=Brevundimonas alba TaxID=74314 RepID=A0A7X5YNQ6_9CAUL|nr:hypothetical protein [Brevundimonas alba]NJC42586.1 hypothetical protein [Brevundimonas alba]
MSRPPRRPRLGWKALLFWLVDHKAILGLPIAVAGIVAVWIVLDPHYPPKLVVGRITDLGRAPGPRAIVNAATVDVGGRSIFVGLPVRYGCEVGDDLRLQQLGVRWGYSYRIDDTHPPCE